ncbi:hypothetical protein HIM_11171 [Hirsutella minnesotensis 3608]|uniref:NAD-dependent epimerase/dehydratase domain-containing protein n=1 Tax=Hirsutella minnesotensis 3608 TaxID=1043627 RepID=A0A0F7ZWR7_9HYPO|nr:hypothetical protein HIM_11171 [Hirsutella minnesotensis 3608]
MSAIPKGSLVLVTGVNGYIGSHVAEQLLQHGFRVRGTARDSYKAAYTCELFLAKYNEAVFEVQVVQDMASDGAFDEAVKGCEGVIHVASDLTLNPNPHRVIPMVLSGVKNALVAAAGTPSVKRFVYTSSSTAATAPIVNTKFHVDVNMWNEADVEAAWAPPPYEGYARELAVFVFNTVLPNCNIGKILSPRQQASTGGWYKKMWQGDTEILKLLRGKFPPQHYVNVTDTALLHLAALIEEDVVGERLLAFAGPFNFNDTADVMGKLKDKERPEELLRRYGRPGFTSLEVSLRESEKP